MYYQRKYLQFNDLVFDNYDMLSEYDAGQVSTKVNSIPYTFGNGSYVPLKDKYNFYEEYNVSMTLKLNMEKIPCDFRRFYRSFVITELSKGGKLWAIQNNELVWSYAICTGYNEDTDPSNDVLMVDVDFLIYEGVWHKAHKQKTFIIPFYVCEFLDCLNYKDYQPCKNNLSDWDCLDECRTKKEEGEICECDTPETEPPEGEFCEICGCDTITKDDALCYNIDKLQDIFFSNCNPSYKIIESCKKALEYFTTTTNKRLGMRYCSHCNDINASVYIDTDIPTRDYEITIHGCMHNPFVEVNGKGIEVLGDYNGYMTFFGSGDVYYTDLDECCGDWIDLEQVIIKPYKDEETLNEIMYNEELGFTFHPRYNTVVVDMGICPSGNPSGIDGEVHTAGMNCMYIDVDSKTI